MGKKPLIWGFFFVLLLGISAMAHARMNFPFFWRHHKTTSQSMQTPSALARTEPGASPYRSGWDTGYKSGYAGGQADHTSGAKFDADDAPGYKAGHSSCESLEGKAEHQCRKGYRKGFKLGYQDGYSGLVSRLMTIQESAPSQAAAAPEPTPTEPEIKTEPEEQPSTAMEETPPPASESGTISETTQAQNQPKALPKTASSLPLFGLIGLAGISLSLLSRAVRSM